jgi:hypothetical protein
MRRPVLAFVLSCVVALESAGCASFGSGDFAPIDGRGPRTSAPARDGSVLVHLSDPSVVLERRYARQGAWFEACRAPCDMLMPRADDYRVTRNGTPTRVPFEITAPPGSRVTVDVNTSSSDSSGVDAAVAGVVGGLLLVGLVVGYAMLGGSGSDN